MIASSPKGDIRPDDCELVLPVDLTIWSKVLSTPCIREYCSTPSGIASDPDRVEPSLRGAPNVLAKVSKIPIRYYLIKSRSNS